MANSHYKNALRNESKIRTAFMSELIQFSFILVVFMLVSTITFGLLLGSDGIKNLLVIWLSELRTDGMMGNINLYYFDRGEGALLTGSPYAVPVLKQTLSSLSSNMFWAALSGIAAAVLSYFAYFKWFAFASLERFVRGGKFVSHRQLIGIMSSVVRKDKSARIPIKIAGIPIPETKEQVHYMFTGDTGTGKSQSLMEMMDTVAARKSKALVWDKSGELVQHYYRPGKDIILNPFDERCPDWSIYGEADEIYEFEAIATSFIPKPSRSDSQSHWSEAAQTVFSWLFYRLKKELKREPSIDDLMKTLIDSETVVEKNALGDDVIMRKRELDRIIKGSLASMVVNPDSPEHANSVISTLVPKIRALWYLRGLETKERFSLRNWAENDDDDRWVFIRVNSQQLPSVNPLITAWLDIAISAALSLKKNPHRQIWAFLDELQSLDKLTSLEKGLNEGRKHGLRFVLGFTSVAKLYDLYGEKTFKSLVSMCGTKMVYRTSEPDMAEWASKLLTSKEIISERGSVQSGTHNDSTGSSEQREKLALVMADEIMTQPDLHFYIRLPDQYPTAHVSIKYTSRPDVAEPFLKRTLPEETSYSSIPGLDQLTAQNPKQANKSMTESKKSPTQTFLL